MMQVVPIKTEKILAGVQTIEEVLDKNIANLEEKSVVAVTSKIVSICEGRVVKIGDKTKDELIVQEAQYLIPRKLSKYDWVLTITKNNLIATAGIDESNGNGNYILWPEDPQASANRIREFLRNKFKLKELGVIITDSKTTPMRWGVTAFSLAYSGFKPLKNYRGTLDLFGRPFKYEQISLIDSLATSAALVMGEGNEQTPLSIISDLPFLEFHDPDPTQEELDSIKIDMETDLYSLLLKNAPWEKGKGKIKDKK